MGMADRTAPDIEEMRGYRQRFSNWGRWGADDQRGTVNHITPDVRTAAAALVREGRTVSLSHPLAKRPGPRNLNPVQHHMLSTGPVFSGDYIGIAYHGLVNTHLDALCHVFAEDGRLYNGFPASDVTAQGARSDSIDAYREGIVTRGVLYDIPRLRGVEYLDPGEPVHSWELADAARAQGIEPRAGDAVIVRSGLAPFYRDHQEAHGPVPRPGVHGSVVEFLYETSAALMSWDALDAAAPGWATNEWMLPVHQICVPYLGMPLLDNASLEPLATTCAELGRWEFCLVVAPLVLEQGTGSPVNPIAMF